MKSLEEKIKFQVSSFKFQVQGAESGSREPESRIPTPLTTDSDPQVSSLKSQASSNIFRREGDYWTLIYAGTVLRLRNTKGLHYIAYLLRHPGREFHVADLVAAVDKPSRERFSLVSSDLSAGQMTAQSLRVSGLGDTGAVLDRQAQVAYKQRLAVLREELIEAERNHDPERTTRLQQEIDFITTELADAYGLGGRARKTAVAAERVRKAVANRIKESLAKMRKPHSSLWLHLFNTIKTGTFCSYTPEKPTVWDL